MTQLTDTMSRVQAAAEAVGLAEFARLAGVPYTTLRSFADRGWSNKNVLVLQKLADAAAKVESRDGS